MCFDGGDYPTLQIADVHGTADQPVVFRPIPGAERAATFTSGSQEFGVGVYVVRSEHVHVYDLHLVDSQSGIGVASSAFVRVEGLLIERLGQEGLAVGRERALPRSREPFLGLASHDIDVIGNTVRDTGNVTARYGEGIYIGTGGFDGDDTHDVFVAYNTIEHTRAEGIELKKFTHDVIVRGNGITDGSHFFHAAITVAAQPATFGAGNYLVEDNVITGFRSVGGPVAGIGVGHGPAIVRRNVIAGIDGYGLCTYATGTAVDATFEDNTISDTRDAAIAYDVEPALGAP